MVRTNHTVVGYQRLRLMSRGVNGFWNSHCTQPKMSLRHFWSHRLTVRTSGFHPGNPGSIPGGITKERASSSTREGSNLETKNYSKLSSFLC